MYPFLNQHHRNEMSIWLSLYKNVWASSCKLWNPCEGGLQTLNPKPWSLNPRPYKKKRPFQIGLKMVLHSRLGRVPTLNPEPHVSMLHPPHYPLTHISLVWIWSHGGYRIAVILAPAFTSGQRLHCQALPC